MSWDRISAAVGMGEGGALRNALEGLSAWLARGGALRRPGPRSAAFTTAVVALAAKMAKADGVAVPAEADAFQRVFHLPDHETENIVRLYDLAKQDVAGYEEYARRIAGMLGDEPDLLRTVLECLLYIATADGMLHEAEDAFLRTVAEAFGIPGREYLCIRSTFVHDPSSPYQLLGVSPNTSDAELKARYRALALEHHPDRLISRGVPPEFLAAAGRRLAAINAAYEAILKQRGSRELRAGEQQP